MPSPKHFLHAERCACPRHKRIPPPKPFSPIRGLEFRSHNAWEIAKLAVDSFNGNHSLGVTQQAALLRWKHLDPIHNFRVKHFSDMLDIISELFFLGQLPNPFLQAAWAILPSHVYGHTRPGDRHGVPDRISLNSAMVYLQHSRRAVIRVLLHEAAHAFLFRYTQDNQCSRSDLGVTGHSRAWQYLVKAIEMRTGRLLGLTGSLGREDGLANELAQGGGFPCQFDMKLLYSEFPRYAWFRTFVKAKDDIAVRGIAATKGVYRNACIVKARRERGRRRSI